MPNALEDGNMSDVNELANAGAVVAPGVACCERADFGHERACPSRNVLADGLMRQLEECQDVVIVWRRVAMNIQTERDELLREREEVLQRLASTRLALEELKAAR